MNSFLDPVEFSIASKGLRFANYIIDLILFLIFFVVLFISLELMGFEFLFYLDANPLVDRLFTAVMYVLFMALQEIIFKGRSVGKFLTGTMVVMEDGSQPEAQNYFLRSLCRAIPFDALSFLGNKGWHDGIPKTRVVSKKEFEMNQSKFNAIDQIGVNS